MTMQRSKRVAKLKIVVSKLLILQNEMKAVNNIIRVSSVHIIVYLKLILYSCECVQHYIVFLLR